MTSATLDALAHDSEVIETGHEPPELSPDELIAQDRIPEGYTRDKDTGEIRPKKRRGRRGNPPPGHTEPLERGQDAPPDSKVKGKVQKSTPRYQKGVIGAGMTKLYKRTGRIIKSFDKPIGVAVVESAEDCGEAWDELARTNPRVRRFLMKLISGGAWGALLMAHVPIFMAVVMRDGIRQHIPFLNLIKSVLAEDEDGPSDISAMLGGLKPEDVQQMMSMAQGMMGKVAAQATNGEPAE